VVELLEGRMDQLIDRHLARMAVVRAYARRAQNVDRMILACFVLGLSTRKVAAALLPVLGRPVRRSSTFVSPPPRAPPSGSSGWAIWCAAG
jgi:hypothetical protein